MDELKPIKVIHQKIKFFFCIYYMEGIVEVDCIVAFTENIYNFLQCMQIHATHSIVIFSTIFYDVIK